MHTVPPSDRYVHREFFRTGDQVDNLVQLGRYLVTRRETIGTLRFADDAFDSMGPGPASPRDEPPGRALPPLALGPLAGIAAEVQESWSGYLQRCFAIAIGSDLELWVEGDNWGRTDPSPVGAALRLMYLLDYGLPWDWEPISRGEVESDYADNSFLWDRLDMLPPEAAS